MSRATMAHAKTASADTAPERPARRKADDIPSALAAIWEKIRELGGIDLRSLALVRMGLGLIILQDLIDRFGDLRAHYTDWGVLPRGALIEKFSESVWRTSIYFASGHEIVMGLLMVFAAFWAVCFAVGFRTRLAGIISWAMLCWLHTRNHMVLQSGDGLLRLTLMFCLFLPCHARWSIDNILRKGPAPVLPNPYLHGASIAVLLQLCFVYWFTVIQKMPAKGPFDWRDGDAVFYALHIDQFATPLGLWLREQSRDLLELLTFATLKLEWWGPTLCFLPFLTGPIRFLVVMAFLGFHLFGLNLTMKLGFFPYICAVCWLLFLPPWFWDRFVPALQRCVPAAWLSRAAQVRDTAAQRIEWFALRNLAPRPRTGRGWQWPAAPPGLRRAGFVGANVLALALIAYNFMWCYRATDFDWWNKSVWVKVFPYSLNHIGLGLFLDQNWAMFAPTPLKDDGWYIVQGKLIDGSEVDVLTGKPVTFVKPSPVSNQFKNDRWRKYWMNIWGRNNTDHRLYLGRYLTRQWNERHRESKQLDSFKIIYMQENTLPQGPAQPFPVVIWEHKCR